HLRNLRNFSEELAYAPATVESLGLGHRRSLAAFWLRLAKVTTAAVGGPFKTGENPFPEGRFRPSGKRFPLQGSVTRRSGPGRHRRTGAPSADDRKSLLQLDLGAGCFQLGLDLVRVGLGNGFLDRLRSAFD